MAAVTPGSTILHGFTDQPAASLAELAKSWNRPPAVEDVRNGESNGYDHNQRAYVLTATARPISLTLRGSKNSPIHNPCLVIGNRTPAGGTTRILYFDLRSESPTRFEIRAASLE